MMFSFKITQAVNTEFLYLKEDTMRKLHRRCSRCDLCSDSYMNDNHPLFLAAPSLASYQQMLHSISFHTDADTGETICSQCLYYDETNKIEYENTEEDEDALLEESFDE